MKMPRLMPQSNPLEDATLLRALLFRVARAKRLNLTCFWSNCREIVDLTQERCVLELRQCLVLLLERFPSPLCHRLFSSTAWSIGLSQSPEDLECRS